MKRFTCCRRLPGRWIWILVAALGAALSPERGVAQAPPAGASAVNWATKTMDEIRQGAERGDAVAQRVLGNACLTGQGMPQNLPLAVQWFRKAAEQKDALSQFAIGMLHDEGKGVPQDLKEAARWFRLAADQGLPEAQYNLGVCYAEGEGVGKDEIEAVKWFRRAAEQKDVQAQAYLGLALREGKGVERNPAEAASWLRRAAYNGDMVAQFFLGMMHRDGDGVAKDLPDAIKWVRRSAEAGYAEAQYFLGTAYFSGEGLEKDQASAVQWFQKSAAGGHPRAMAALGQAFGKGEGVKADAAESLKWYRLAAEKGDASAQYQLGLAFQSGRGVSADPAQAQQWLQKAAEQGHSQARALLVGTGAAPGPVASKPAPLGSNTMAKALPPPPGVREVRAPETGAFPSPPAPGGTPPKPLPTTTGEAGAENPQSLAAGKTERGAGTDRLAGLSFGGEPRYNLSALLAILAIACGVMAVTGLVALVYVRGRMASLQEEIQETKYELAKANVSLTIIQRTVEEMALEARLHAPDANDRAGAGAAAPRQPEAVSFRPQRARGGV